ncbi:MAG TPA: hypothetical protein VFE12_15350 [Acetobacteraceae bacterium]|nr:hypothetical protein [Acetobacteraceae bacterium]
MATGMLGRLMIVISSHGKKPPMAKAIGSRVNGQNTIAKMPTKRKSFWRKP